MEVGEAGFIYCDWLFIPVVYECNAGGGSASEKDAALEGIDKAQGSAAERFFENL